MKILRLPIKTEWFDMILSGVMPVVYRQNNKSISRRLYSTKGNLKYFDALELTEGHLGAAKARPTVRYEFQKLEITAHGKKKWGAKKGKVYYCIQLGKLLETHNLKQYQLGLKEMRSPLSPSGGITLPPNNNEK